MTGTDVILKVCDISKSFPGVQALDSVDFELKKGEIHALVGENGAGKSTLIKILCGVYPPDSGKIILDGKEIVLKSPHDAYLNGISAVYQESILVPYLTVADNLFLGREENESMIRFFTKNRRMQQLASKYLNNIGVTNVNPNSLVKDLGIADQQLVCIAKSISANAKVFIFDEATSALTSEKVEKLFEVIRLIKGEGYSVIYITHRLREIFQIADRVTVMRGGRIVDTKSINECNIPEVIRMMVGHKVESDVSYVSNKYKTMNVKPVLKVSGLKRKGVFEDISFEIKEHEVVGLAGLVGSGRTEIVRAIFGADSADGGSVWVDDKQITPSNPYKSIQNSIVLLTENPKEQGLFNELSIKQNMTVSAPKIISLALGLINNSKEKKVVKDYVQSLALKCSSIEQKILSLSGGNKQKVVIARSLIANAKVLIFDEPTRGIDVGTREEIHQIIKTLAKEGKAVLVICSELREMVGLCDRIIVIYRGKIMGELSGEEASEEKIMQMAIGV